MILRPSLSRNDPVERTRATLVFAKSPVPTWLRRAVPEVQNLSAQGPVNCEDVALVAGAAIGALDAVVRRQEKWAGVWR